jgi:hypothetical protein
MFEAVDPAEPQRLLDDVVVGDVGPPLDFL